MKRISRAAMAMACAAMLAPVAARAQAGDAGAFVIRRGNDTIAVESFRRSAGEVSGELGVKSAVRVVYSLRIGAAQAVTGVEMRAWAPGAADTMPPLQHITVGWAGDSAVVVMEGGGQRMAQTVKGAAGALPIVNPSTVVIEQVLMHARQSRADSVSVPVFVIGTTQVVRSTVVFHGDSATISIGPVVHAAVDGSGRLLGAAIPSQNLVITRVANASSALAPEYSAPAGAPYTAEEVRVPHPAGHRLAGTLTLPAGRRGRVPAVITITGSGAQDRDESIPSVPGYRPFRQVADTLGRRGIAVLRMDDRGFGASEGNGGIATTRDFATDIAAAVAYLRARPEIDPDRIALVGHSEGGIIAPVVAAADPRIRAVVLMAGTSRSGRRILEYQIRYPLDRDSSLTAAQRDSAYRAGWAEVDSLGARMPWLPYFIGYDPLPTLRRVRQPVLIVQGGTDRQVTADQAPELDAALRAAGNRDVTLRVFPELNHLFIHDPSGMPAGYGRLPHRAVEPEVLGTIADWLAVKLR
ncbi:MAG TPA: alpha/beta fold hydrolase [Longimicrobium sp.]|nr:alpha/beta fold hydrolase [Longimicrobium sp.]